MKRWKLISKEFMLVEIVQDGLLQISKAVYEGAKAGLEVIKRIRKEGLREAP